MNKYIVCYKKWKDSNDNNHIYANGDDYPREGASEAAITEKRIAALVSSDNKIGVPLIRLKEFDEYTLNELVEYCNSNNIYYDELNFNKETLLSLIDVSLDSKLSEEENTDSSETTEGEEDTEPSETTEGEENTEPSETTNEDNISKSSSLNTKSNKYARRNARK